MGVPAVIPRRVIDPYTEGYQAAEVCRTHMRGCLVQDTPLCPYEPRTLQYETWFAGVHDSTMDRYYAGRRGGAPVKPKPPYA